MPTDDELRKLLHDSQMGVKKFHTKYGKQYGITLKRITELSRQSHVAQVMAPAKAAVFQRIVAPDYSFQIDLTFWGHRDHPEAIMFVCIEMTSRKLWAEIIKNKQSDSCLPVFKKIISEVAADVKSDDAEFGYIAADDGGEWSELKKFCEKLEIPWRVYTGDNKSRKMGLVERANRQIKDRIRQFMEPVSGDGDDVVYKQPKNAWKAELPRFIVNYNETVHSTINMTPNDAYARMGAAREHLREREPDWKSEKFQVGDAVRLKVYKDNIFTKKVNTWTRETYTVSEITDTGIVVEGGERPYQRYELLKIPKGKVWNAPTKEVLKAHKEAETEEAKAIRLKAVEKELGPVEELAPRAKAVPEPVLKPMPSLVRKAYKVLAHRGTGDAFELHVEREVRKKVVVDWYPLSSFIRNGGIDSGAYEYIMKHKLEKAADI